jgi:hypothetical protein
VDAVLKILWQIEDGDNNLTLYDFFSGYTAVLDVVLAGAQNDEASLMS